MGYMVPSEKEAGESDSKEMTMEAEVGDYEDRIFEDAKLVALKVNEGIMSQGMGASSASRER